MKNEILKLRSEGKTYNEIKEILNCSKSTISYYCGEGQKEKNIERTKKRRNNIIVKKLDNFKYRKKRAIKEQTRRFNKTNRNSKYGVDKNIKQTFGIDDVIEKFGVNTICYLSGEKINLYKDTYRFDHIIPVSKNGDNSIDNLGITHKVINEMKSDLTPNEFIEWCVKVLKHNGYTINK